LFGAGLALLLAKTPRGEPDEEVDRPARAVIDAAIEVHRVLGPGDVARLAAGVKRVVLGPVA